MIHAIPQSVLTKHTAVVGMTGSGKTSTSKLLIEQVAGDGSRVCILDPIKSDWWGLTSNKAGTGPGLPFQILGGPHGHVPLHAGAGAAIADLVASGKLPLSIIDMADFGPGGLQHFFNEFAPVLVKKMRGVLYLVIEEAHEFCPKEKSGVTGEQMSVYYAKKLATAGRSKGVRLVVATQRVQALHNAVLSSCETVIVHRMTYPADQEPVTKWLKGSVKDKEVRLQIEESMPELADGEGWICSGSAKILQRIQFPRIQTFDNSATPEDDSHRTAVVTAKVDVTQLRALIGNAVKDAESNDVDALKKRIRELEARPLTQISDPVIDQVMLEEARAAGFQSGYKMAKREDWGALRNDLSSRLYRLRGEITHAVEELQKELNFERDSGAGFEATCPPAPPVRLTGSEERSMTEAVRRSPRVVDSGSIKPKADGGAARRILIALAQANEYVTHRRLGILADVKPGGSTWRGVMAKFRQQQFVDELSDAMRITPAGKKHLGDYTPLPTGKALRDYWRAKIGNSTRGQIFEAILAAGGKPVSAETVAAVAGVELGGSTWRGHMAKLRGLELVSGSTELRASEELF